MKLPFINVRTASWSRTSRLMLGFAGISLGWILFTGDSCLSDLGIPGCEKTKRDRYPGYWVTCVDNKPVLMQYFQDFPVSVGNPGSLNPQDWDCTHPDSPHYKKSEKGVIPPYPSFGPGGPLSIFQPRAVGGATSYLPQRVRSLPFVPQIPPPATPPGCDSTFPDVLQTNHNNARVIRISTCPFTVKASIPVVSRPLQVDVTPDGTTALVTSFDNAVNFIDLATNTVSFTLRTDSNITPHGLAISPDGTRAYITSFNPERPVVQVIDLASRKVIATIPTITYPQGATLTPDGSQLWITSPLASSVDIIDTLTNTSVTGLGIGQTTDVAFNSTGTRAYITSALNSPGDVIVVDTATYQTIRSYKVGMAPADIMMSYGDEFLIVNNDVGNSVSIIDLVKDTVVTTNVGTSPSGIAFVR